MKMKPLPPLGKYSPIVRNASWLTLFEVMRILMPFIAMPYLIHTVGRERYGAVVVAQAIIAFASLLVNFGLDISAVKDIAQCRDDRRKTDETVSAVMILKTLLFFCAWAILIFLIHASPYFGRMSLLLCNAFPACVADVLVPVWYYQGKENLRMLTFVRFFSIAFYTLTIFIFVRSEGDYANIPLLQSAGLILSGLASCYLVFVKDGVRFRVPAAAVIVRKFRESVPFFFSRASLAVNAQMAKIMCGAWLGNADVTAFDVAQKICNGGMMPVQMFCQALYPNLSKSRDRSLLRHSFGVTALITTAVAVALFFAAGFATDLLSAGRTPQSAAILRILCLYVFFSGFSVFTGASALVVFDRQRPFNASIILSSLVLVACYALMIATGSNSIYLYAWTLVLAECVVLAYRFYYCRKYGLIDWRDAVPRRKANR
ncbi:MAG: oligosaccharide flippase family protein [Tannerella sp.]|jgi:PST family polysaccharide transporter|nr:oligosaccharide flippase family protein [Tannerella sp.]